MKKSYIVCALSSLLVIVAAFLLHLYLETIVEKTLKIGVIYVGDEVTPYTDNFIDAQKHVQEVFGDRVEFVERYNVNEDKCEEPMRELIAEKCDYIITPSFGYIGTTKMLANEYPDIEFCAPTGNNANDDPVLTNYHTCMGTIYQGRYICGVVAGMKLKEMIDDGVIDSSQAKAGYVAAYPYAEVISGYTAFLLGIRSVVPEATMLVKYANTWSNYTIEKNIADELIEEGCVIISQHSDTTGPAVACENAKTEYPVYHVGYNQSMTEIAPTSSLVSCSIDYSMYFEQSVAAMLDDKKIESEVDAEVNGQDVMAGIEKGWVKILDINRAVVAEGTEEKVAELEKDFTNGKIEVFKGDYTGTNPFDETDVIDLTNGYKENANSSAPSFNYVLDDIITILE